jgi:hypothetical protein
MSYKHLIFVIFLAFISIDNCLSYVVCPDAISACDDKFICCQKGTGYRCCPSSSCCCKDGSYCCSCSSLTFLGFNLSEIQSSSAHLLSEVRSPILDLSFNSTDIEIDTKIIKSNGENAFYGAYLMLDSFLNVTGYYKHYRSTEGCKNEFLTVVQDVIKAISIINNTTYIEPAEFFSELSADIAENFYHARETLSNCKHVKEEFKLMLDSTYNYITSPDNDYLLKFLINLKGSLPQILSYVNQIKTLCILENYEECGTFIGLLFNKVFEI